jgi:hypothetical protein
MVSRFPAAIPWGGIIKAGTDGVLLSITDIKIVDLKRGTRQLPPGKIGEKFRAS